MGKWVARADDERLEQIARIEPGRLAFPPRAWLTAGARPHGLLDPVVLGEYAVCQLGLGYRPVRARLTAVVGAVAECSAALVVGIGAGVEAGIDHDREPDVLTELFGERGRDRPAEPRLDDVLGELVGHSEQRGVVDDGVEPAESDERQVLAG